MSAYGQFRCLPVMQQFGRRRGVSVGGFYGEGSSLGRVVWGWGWGGRESSWGRVVGGGGGEGLGGGLGRRSWFFFATGPVVGGDRRVKADVCVLYESDAVGPKGDLPADPLRV